MSNLTLKTEEECLVTWRNYWLSKKMAAEIDLHRAIKQSLIVPIMTTDAIEKATEEADGVKAVSKETIKSAEEIIGAIDEMLKKYGKTGS